MALYSRAAVEPDDVARHGGDVTGACWDDGVTVRCSRGRWEGQGPVLLLEHGADTDREGDGGRTPRAMADQLDHREMQQLFGSPAIWRS